jgi:Cys-rich repeat protein
MEPSLIADLVARLLALPADKVTVWHFLFLAVGVFGLSLPGLIWGRNHDKRVRFLREATPEQLAAYNASPMPPPPKGPGLSGPVVILGLLLLVGIARGGVTVAASEESRPECQSDRQCPSGQYCLKGSCVSNAHKGKSGKQKVAASGPLGMEYEVRDPERPTVDWVQRNL